MTDEQLDAMHEEARKDVKVSCCEFHQHSALMGCLSGDAMAIAVCVLCEEFRKLRSKLKGLCKDAGISSA